MYLPVRVSTLMRSPVLMNSGAEIVILLCGGDKRTQRADIKRAQQLAESL